MKKPFTEKEQKIMDLLVEAHNNFIELETTHPMEVSEWVSNFHKLQDLLGARVLRRDYPKTFTSIYWMNQRNRIDSKLRTWLFCGGRGKKHFEIEISAEDRETAIAYFETNYPELKWLMTKTL
jgi:hypothetical protein